MSQSLPEGVWIQGCRSGCHRRSRRILAARSLPRVRWLLVNWGQVPEDSVAQRPQAVSPCQCRLPTSPSPKQVSNACQSKRGSALARQTFSDGIVSHTDDLSSWHTGYSG
ncbi:hypothetical protein SKAU_G00364580 [Synaphobranchus kaupii]|uniref:Uncharacterized protein n=1 Tax=Synaphobranchus kaupii TaxID=118154 RepID=A0A9Q1EES9_SYNKA|nr:hypothetical protein SKAU_G00364580 [Synaphobranchus kaupii]